MDVPSPAAGTVDRGARIAQRQGLGGESDPFAREPPRGSVGRLERGHRPVAQSRPPPPTSPDADRKTQVLVIGAGPGGYTAAFRAADLGLEVTLVERYERLGGVCLNVGCIPSKALLHAARVIAETEEAAEFGIEFGEPEIDLDRLRAWKDEVVGKLTGGLGGLAKQRKVEVVTGTAQVHVRPVVDVDGTTIAFESCILAAGSQRGDAAGPARGRSGRGLDRGARAGRRPGAAAGHRRRDHRARARRRLRRARQRRHRGRDDRPADPRLRPRPGQAAAAAPRGERFEAILLVDEGGLGRRPGRRACG